MTDDDSSNFVPKMCLPLTHISMRSAGLVILTSIKIAYSFSCLLSPHHTDNL